MIKTRHVPLSVLLVGLLTACGARASAGSGGPETLELRYQGSVGAVTFPEFAEALGYLGPVKLKWIGNTISGPQDIQAAATGQTDFGGAFNGAIVKLAAAKAPIKAVIGYYGSDKDSYIGYFVPDGSPVKGPRDLIGKKIGVNTLGAHLEAVLKEYLKRGGLTPDEIKQVELVVVPPVNTEQALRQGQIDVAALSGILRDKALRRGGIHPLFKDIDLFGPFTAGSVVLTEKFIERNPETTKKFVEAYARAVEWTQTHSREEVVAKAKEIIAKRGRNEDTTAIEFWKSSGVANKGGVIDAREFQTWIDWLEREGEIDKGQVKAEDLFTNAYNPFGGTR
ncbi:MULTISPECIES: ABC transporter substrate-binding protein [Streptosporangium]|uniref:ABC-type nitrate/sulfonate/bicarbonate transport system substrate-binding protein n=1 Tax=Streptosporangium brasiliense TaxID=47480 RepID=A0ABT9R7U2_9ACTN|nr:ABC transporter substrate-binding protein [Streptosporangium brasiliense]MDP9865305.1 ABC-type nitrate/sulfonate/bicarbonate transport system substrate-binding protein [Streptosporangium brasiliense]